MAKARSLKGQRFFPAVPTGLVSHCWKGLAEQSVLERGSLILYIFHGSLWKVKSQDQSMFSGMLGIAASKQFGRGWNLRGSSLVQCHLARYKERSTREISWNETGVRLQPVTSWLCSPGSMASAFLLQGAQPRTGVQHCLVHTCTDSKGVLLERFGWTSWKSWIELNGQPWDCVKMSEVDMTAGCNATLKGCERASEWQKDGLFEFTFSQRWCFWT